MLKYRKETRVEETKKAPETKSDMGEILKLSVCELKKIMINILRALMEKVNNTENKIKHCKQCKKRDRYSKISKKEMQEIHNTIIEMKNICF